MLNRPLIPEVGVLALVPYRWSELWLACHHVLTRLAKYFHVVWVNPAQDWEEAFRLRKDRATFTLNELPSGFAIYSPERWLPTIYRPNWLAHLSCRVRLGRAQKLLFQRGCQKTILYIWRPEFADTLSAIDFHLSCYHIDDEYSFSPVDNPTPEAEVRLIRAVDQVFIHSPALLEKKGTINPCSLFVPNGVDYRAYAQKAEPPSDLAKIPHPRIGYAGHLKKQLDWPLLLDLCSQHLEWSFLFVGAVNAHPEIIPFVEALSKSENVYFLGKKSVTELATYPQHFDVCIMPYKTDAYTKYIYPLKLHEYLASGQPVVGTRIRSLEAFETVVTLASSYKEWCTAINESLGAAANSAQQQSARQAVARQHDWDLLVLRIVEVMAQRLGGSFLDILQSNSSLGVISRVTEPRSS